MSDLSHHREAHPDVAGYLLGTLSDDETAAFAAHLASCSVCRAELDNLGSLVTLLGDLPDIEALPADLEERTFAAIEVAARDDGRTASGNQEPNTIVDLRSVRVARRWSTVQLGLTAVAAAVIAIAAVGIAVQLRKSSPAPPTAIEQLVAPNGGSAHGTATIHATLTGTIIDLSVRGLKPSPAGTIYTCWLVGKGDTLQHQNRVSVGSFLVGASGSASVQWETGASLRRFPTLGVTLEPEDGNPLHQGPKVLAEA